MDVKLKPNEEGQYKQIKDHTRIYPAKKKKNNGRPMPPT